MAVTLEVEGGNVVVVGNFNPAIFSPLWLLSTNLIEQADHDAAVIDVIHPEICSFRTEWFQLTVELQKASFVSINPIGVRIFDLCCRIFGEVLPQTPLSAIGINFVSHFRVGSEITQHKLGDALAPKEPWGTWGEELNRLPPKGSPNRRSSSSRSGGLRTMTMMQYERPDGLPGNNQVKIEPSVVYFPGIYVEVNNHIDLPRPSNGEDNSVVFKNLSNTFDESITSAKAFVSHFMNICEEFERERA